MKLSKLADLISSPKITLSWLMQGIGAPAFIISLIVPIREIDASGHDVRRMDHKRVVPWLGKHVC